MLNQLGDRQAVLMMYLAGEFPSEDKAEVEQMLATDPAMRVELESLREAHAVFAAVMPTLDRADRMPVPQSVGVRRVTGAIRQWHAKRMARPVAALATPSLRYPWWTYPLAAAASVVIAFVVWWGNSSRPERPIEVVQNEDAYDGSYYSSQDMDLAIAWSMGGPAEEIDDGGSLVEPSDYNIFFLIDYSDTGGTAPRSDASNPGFEEDDFFL